MTGSLFSIGKRSALERLKAWLRRKQPKTVQVRTYGGDFELPAGKPASAFDFDELVQFAEANPNLKMIGADQMQILSPSQPDDGLKRSLHPFHEQMKQLSLGWARYVVVLRNRFR